MVIVFLHKGIQLSTKELKYTPQLGDVIDLAGRTYTVTAISHKGCKVYLQLA